MRGLIPATMINYICKEVKKEVFEMFDCVGGTSIGGIIALGSTGTLDGKTPIADHDDIVKIFEENGT
jgi:patatin-like phospholipase/acyl hydrolase